MAILFDEVDDHFIISDDPSMTIPDDCWCVAIWTRVTDNSGTLFQYILSNNNYGVNSSLNLWLKETGGGANSDSWGFLLVDDDGTSVGAAYSTSAPGADGVWRLVVLQCCRVQQLIELFFCEFGGTPSLEATRAAATLDAINGGDWYIGARADLDADRFYGSEACEFFKGDFRLTTDEIAALGSGHSIYSLGYTPSVYLIMGESVPTLVDLFDSNDAARQSLPTTVEHVPVIRPNEVATKIEADVRIPILVVDDGTPMLVRGLVGLGAGFVGSTLRCKVYQPVLIGNKLVDDITNWIGDSWKHKISMERGFDSASCTITGPQDYLQAWFEEGLARHIELEDMEGHVCWEGMIFEMKLDVAGQTQTLSLADLGNKVMVIYPSVIGEQLWTAWAEDLDSQARYGVKEKVHTISGGIGIVAARAIAVRDMELRRSAWPARSKTASQPGEASLTLTLKGYLDTLAWLAYNDTTDTGTEDCSVMVDRVITAVGQFIADTIVTENTLQYSAYHNRNRSGLAILQEIVGSGNGVSPYDPWLLGCYEDRVVVYEPLNTEVNAFWWPDAPCPVRPDGTSLLPWLIRPNHVIRAPAFLPGRELDDWDVDPAVIVVKEVSFDAPYGLSIVGTDDVRIEVLLNRLQLGRW